MNSELAKILYSDLEDGQLSRLLETKDTRFLNKQYYFFYQMGRMRAYQPESVMVSPEQYKQLKGLELKHIFIDELAKKK